MGNKYNRTHLLAEIERIKKGITKKLDLFHFQLSEIPTEILELEELEILFLGSNEITHIPKEIKNLKNLKSLSLSDNKIIEIPTEIGELKNLKFLNFSDNNINSVPSSIGRLSSLNHLILSNNNLSELPESVGNLKQLSILNLAGNNFDKVPNSIYSLKSLKTLQFVSESDIEIPFIRGGNNISTVSDKICQMKNLETFLVVASNFNHPPPEIISRGVKNIQKFFLQIEAEGVDFLYEAKLIIVGEAGAGKTTLARKLVNEDAPLPVDSETTRGIAINNINFEIENKKTFKINIWDFGGQEIYHSTHQFFLTKRSLYVLVADSRKEDTQFNYWLQVIELLSDSSPVLLVHNEKQDRSRDVNISALKHRFENIEDRILKANFATKRGLPELTDAVKFFIQRLPHVGDKLPQTWVRVRKAIEEKSLELNYISDSEFYEICEFNGIQDYEKAIQLSNYLHDLGVFLHFKDGSVLQKTIFLNNSWATDAVYKILDNNYIKDLKKGKVSKNILFQNWNNEVYFFKKEELLALMLKFELCYKVENENLYIIPQLLNVNQPLINWNLENNLKLKYQYNFMPKGIISNFIVRMNSYIQSHDLVWRSGVHLSNDFGDEALVIETYDNREIQIFVKGKEPRFFLNIIIEEIDKINRKYPSLIVKKLIQCNCIECEKLEEPNFYEFNDLLRRKTKGKPTIECKISYIDVSVSDLIDRGFSVGNIKRSTVKRVNEIKSKDSSKRQVFISYSHKDKKYLSDFKRLFAPLKNQITFWDDSNIQPGEYWKAEIEDALEVSQFAIVFLSPDYFNSDFIQKNELPQILSNNKNKNVKILGVIVKPIFIDENSPFAKFQLINFTDNPVVKMKVLERDELWIKILKIIAE